MSNLGWALGGLGVAALAAVVGTEVVKNGMSEKKALDRAADRALDRYLRDNPIQIREEQIASAVDRATDNRVRTYVERVGSDIMRNATNAIKKRVDEAYNKEESHITSRFGEELTAKVYELNKKDIRERIANKAEEVLEDKLDSCLDDMIDEWLDDQGEHIVSERAREATKTFRRW